MKVYGIKPPGDEWELKATAYEACKNAGVEIPRELVTFFNGVPPDPRGVWLNLEDTPYAHRFTEEDEIGFDVDLQALRKEQGVTVIRFAILR